MKPFLKILSIGVCLLSLSACETVEGIKQDIASINFDSFEPAASASSEEHAEFLVDGNCPQIQIVDDLSRLYEFNEGQSMKSANLVSSVIMEKAQSTCSHGDRSVTVDLKLSFNGKLGPKGRHSSKEKPFFSYPFFVAVTSDSGKILAKEIFAASMTYDAGQSEQLYFETLRQIIPADSQAQSSRYKVMVGFQIAEKQLAYNRKILEAEQKAAMELEKQRIEAQKEAEKMAQQQAKEAEKQKETSSGITIEKTSSMATEPETAQTTANAGPFDIFRTNNN